MSVQTWYKRCFLRLPSVVLCAFLILTACSSVTSFPGVQLVTSFPGVQLTQAHSIRIQDDYEGFSPISPVNAHYNIKLSQNQKQFIGKASFVVGGRSFPESRRRQASADLTIPFEAVQTFLRMLDSSPLKEGNYIPLINQGDDYPSFSIEIKLELKTGTVVFFTQSQGDDHVPWGVVFKRKEYVINSDVPAKALSQLKPYLKPDVLERLKQQSH